MNTKIFIVKVNKENSLKLTYHCLLWFLSAWRWSRSWSSVVTIHTDVVTCLVITSKMNSSRGRTHHTFFHFAAIDHMWFISLDPLLRSGGILRAPNRSIFYDDCVELQTKNNLHTVLSSADNGHVIFFFDDFSVFLYNSIHNNEFHLHSVLGILYASMAAPVCSTCRWSVHLVILAATIHKPIVALQAAHNAQIFPE